MAKKEDLIVGLDIGTTKVCVIVAAPNGDGIDIIGIGTHPSRGLRKGVVVDIDATVHSIKQAVEEAELMADCEISSVYAGIAGSHIRAFNSHGVVAVKDREVIAERREARDRRRQGRLDPDGPRGHPRDPAGVHHRRPGRHPRAARHERGAPRGEDPHRHRGRHERPEHRQVREQGRAQRDGHRARAARVGGGLPRRGRARPRRVPDRHRRRHHGRGRLLRGLDQAHLGARARRRPRLQRHRGRPAHAVRRGRAGQEEVRRGGGALPRQRRRDQRAERGRPAPARGLAQAAVRDHRAARSTRSSRSRASRS